MNNNLSYFSCKKISIVSKVFLKSSSLRMTLIAKADIERVLERHCQLMLKRAVF
jgi:hypothetical protein